MGYPKFVGKGHSYDDGTYEYVCAACSGRGTVDGSECVWCYGKDADDEAELHDMARRLGLPRSAFHQRVRMSHYDLTPSKRAQAILYGAQEAKAQDLVKRAMSKDDEHQP